MQERLRVETVPVNPWRWLQRIFKITDEEIKAKCGLDGYFYIRFIRAGIVIFSPLMILFVIVLFPINFHGGKSNHRIVLDGHPHTYNVTGREYTLSKMHISLRRASRHHVVSLWTPFETLC